MLFRIKVAAYQNEFVATPFYYIYLSYDVLCKSFTKKVVTQEMAVTLHDVLVQNIHKDVLDVYQNFISIFVRVYRQSLLSLPLSRQPGIQFSSDNS